MHAHKFHFAYGALISTSRGSGGNVSRSRKNERKASKVPLHLEVGECVCLLRDLLMSSANDEYDDPTNVMDAPASPTEEEADRPPDIELGPAFLGVFTKGN